MELLYVVGGLIVFALLWRGVSWLRDYQRRVRVRLEPVPPGPETVDSFPELGKVRVRPRFGDEAAEGAEVPLEPVIVVGARDREGAGSLSANVPTREGAGVGVSFAAERIDRAARAEPSVMTSGSRDLPAAGHPSPEMAGAAQPVAHSPVEPAASTYDAATEESAATSSPRDMSSSVEQPPVLLTPVAAPLHEAEQQDMFADDTVAPPPMAGRTRTRAQALYDTPAVEPVRSVRQADERPHVDVQDVIALHVVARQHPFNGEDLLRCILSYGLRFGDMNIFHRHERPTGQGQVLFSMAKAVEPGTFDLQAMSGEEIPGVSFFLSLPGVSSILAYDIMVDTAKRLATELQGEILDSQSQPLTRQLIEHYRERVQEFERRRLMQRPSH